MKKKRVCNLLVMLAFVICLLCGCGGKSSSSEAWWLKLSNTVSKEKQDTQTEEPSEAVEELEPGYWEFHYLCGLGKEEAQNLLGQELTNPEERFDEYVVYTIEDVEYMFYKEADALCAIRYTNLDVDAAERLASDSYREMMLRYGDDCTFTFQHRVRDICLMEDLRVGVNDRNIEQYNDAWRQPYTREMEEKVKDYYATDKATLALNLLTPHFMDQGTYTVSISHTSVNLKELKSNGNSRN